MTIRSGYGTQRLHLQQPSSNVLANFGDPNKRSRSEGLREYWHYPEMGVECIVSRRSGRVLSIFFKAEVPWIVGTAESLMFGASEDEVRKLYGAPDIEGGGFALSDGAYIGRWFSYRSGIGFHFNESGRVVTISVFARKRASSRRKSQTGASHINLASRSVAALRK